MKKLIVTGDDFGLSIPVNEAIVKAHEKGILTTTSLMVSAPQTEDAIKHAQALPELKIGLHLVLCNGKSLLPANKIFALVNKDREFDRNQVRSGIKMFFNAETKQQLEKEIRAQFDAFKATGLTLDHVNAHKHMHMHPTVFDLIVKIGKDYGLTAIRIPDESPLKSLINSRSEKYKRYFRWLFLSPFVARMKKQCKSNNILFNERIYGLHDSGHMNIETLVRILPHIEEGLTELYLHPATGKWDGMDPAASDYEFESEYKALIHARTLRTIEKFDIKLSGFNT